MVNDTVKRLWPGVLISPVAVGIALGLSNSAAAYTTEPASLLTAAVPNPALVPELPASPENLHIAQLTSITELSDVRPTDWAYSALQNLVETYGCIQGFPNRTYRGVQAMTRYEFAAGLNACLNKIVDLIGVGGVSDSDLATIRRLQEQFQAELATLRGRVDALEADVAELQAQQFSTTTKLNVEVTAHLGTPIDTLPTDTSPTFNARARMNFDTSFTGRDWLRIRFQATSGDAAMASNFGGFSTGSDTSPAGTAYNLVVDDFFYRFPVGDRLNIKLAANGLDMDEVSPAILAYADDRSVGDAGGPQFFDAGTGGSGSGLALSLALTDNIVLDAAYGVNSGVAGNPTQGIFSGSGPNANQAYMAQLSYLSDGFLDAGFAYIHSDGADAFGGTAGGAVDTYAGLLSLDFGGLILGGHVAFAQFAGGSDTSYTAGVVFPDLFMEGGALGIYGGDLPGIYTASNGNNPFLLEVYYNLPVNQFLTITPALIYGDARTGVANRDNTTLYGVLRTVFTF